MSHEIRLIMKSNRISYYLSMLAKKASNLMNLAIRSVWRNENCHMWNIAMLPLEIRELTYIAIGNFRTKSKSCAVIGMKLVLPKENRNKNILREIDLNPSLFWYLFTFSSWSPRQLALRMKEIHLNTSCMWQLSLATNQIIVMYDYALKIIGIGQLRSDWIFNHTYIKVDLAIFEKIWSQIRPSPPLSNLHRSPCNKTKKLIVY